MAIIYLCSSTLALSSGVNIFFTIPGRPLPGFEAVKGILYSLLVVFDHVGVHLWVVTPYVALCAAIWDCTKAEWRVLLLWLLKL